MAIKSILSKHGIKISILLLLIACLTIIVTTFTPAQATEDNHYNFPNDEIKKEAEDKANGMYCYDSSMMSDYIGLTAWMQKGQTFIMTEKDLDGHVSLVFNAPSLRKLVAHYLESISPGGWVSASGYNREVRQDTNSNNWSTAKAKYGYDFPNAFYVGEYPAPILSIEGTTLLGYGVSKVVKIGINIATWPFSGILHLLFGDSGVEQVISQSDIKSFTYATLDYRDANTASLKKYAPWLEEHWQAIKDNIFSGMMIKIDGKSAFDDGVILEKGEKVGGGEGQVNGEELLNRIIKKCEGSTAEFLTGLTGYAHDNPTLGIDWPHDYIIRYMPYDLDTMSSASQEYMNHIADPRVEMFKTMSGPLGLVGIATKSILHSLNDTFIMGWIASFCKWSGDINSICDFKFLTNSGLDLFIAWDGTLGAMLITALGIIVIIFLLRSIGKYLLSKGSRKQILSKAVLVTFVIILCAGFLVNPRQTGNALTTVISNVMSLGTSTLSMNPDFKDFHTDDANQAEKSELRFWLVWYSAWSSYSISHTFGDSEPNQFDTSKWGNEYSYREESPAKLRGNKSINKWPAILLEDLSNNNANDALRTIDHYIAPKIYLTDANNQQFTVERNPYYNNQLPYTTPCIGNLFVAISIFLMVIIKFLCFIELVINIMFLFIRIIYTTFWGSQALKAVVKELFISVGRVILYDVWITLYIYLSLNLDGTRLIFLGLLIFAITIYLYLWLFNIDVPRLGLRFNTKGVTNILRPTIIDFMSNMTTKLATKVTNFKTMTNNRKEMKNKKKEEERKKRVEASEKRHERTEEKLNPDKEKQANKNNQNPNEGSASREPNKQVIDATREGVKNNGKAANESKEDTNNKNDNTNKNTDTANNTQNKSRNTGGGKGAKA